MLGIWHLELAALALGLLDEGQGLLHLPLLDLALQALRLTLQPVTEATSGMRIFDFHSATEGRSTT